jgi:nicotinamide-nucleotide amidase
MRPLQDVLLGPPRRTLALAESVTAGGLQLRVGRISGASQFFLGGITAYNLEQKVRQLGVDRAAAAAVDCVSAGVAEQMAQGVCRLFGADLGLATTGYAEPNLALGVAAPFAWWALAQRQAGGGFALHHGRVDCPGASRAAAQDAIAEAAWAALLRGAQAGAL